MEFSTLWKLFVTKLKDATGFVAVTPSQCKMVLCDCSFVAVQSQSHTGITMEALSYLCKLLSVSCLYLSCQLSHLLLYTHPHTRIPTRAHTHTWRPQACFTAFHIAYNASTKSGCL